MTNLEIVNEEISELERSKINYQVAEKLTWLYVVRDHMMQGHTEPVPVVTTVQEIPQEQVPATNSDSEFISSTSGVNVSDLLNVLDEHMDVLKVVYPKEYSAIIQKIDSLH